MVNKFKLNHLYLFQLEQGVYRVGRCKSISASSGYVLLDISHPHKIIEERWILKDNVTREANPADWELYGP